jgi:hypothetical protein
MPDPVATKCTCPHCRVRSIVGPVMVITVGVLFLIAQYSRYSFADLWPVLLIVLGALLVAQAMAPKQGHVGL